MGFLVKTPEGFEDPRTECISGGSKCDIQGANARIMNQIKNESYFRWPNKMGGDLSRRNQNLYCTYHRDKGHTTEQYRVLKDHLEQLVRAGYLKESVVDPRNQEVG